jgi:hypothetical protein
MHDRLTFIPPESSIQAFCDTGVRMRIVTSSTFGMFERFEGFRPLFQIAVTSTEPPGFIMPEYASQIQILSALCTLNDCNMPLVNTQAHLNTQMAMDNKAYIKSEGWPFAVLSVGRSAMAHQPACRLFHIQGTLAENVFNEFLSLAHEQYLVICNNCHRTPKPRLLL